MVNVIFLKDLCEDIVDAVIVCENSTAEDIEKAISKAKEDPFYDWERLLDCMPDDCVVFDRWSNKTVYY